MGLITTVWNNLARPRGFAGNVTLTTGTNILLALFGILTGVLAARLLGPQGRGELAAIQNLPSSIASIAMLGLAEALIYFAAKDAVRAGRYLGSAILLPLLTSLPFLLIGYWAMPFFLSAQSGEIVSAARGYLWLLPLFALTGMPINLLRGRGDFSAWNFARLLPTSAWVGVLLIAWASQNATPQFLSVGFLIALAVIFFPTLALVVRRIPGPYAPHPADWKPMLRYGLPSMLGGVPQLLNLRLDQILMAAFLPAQLLGLYVVAVAWSNSINPILSALGAALFPRVASQENREQQSRALAQGSRLGVLLAVTVAAGLFVATPWIMPFLFGEAFASAIPVALLLVVAGAVYGYASVLEDGLRGLGHPSAVMWSEIAGLVVTLGSLFIFLPSLQIIGAGLASLLGYSAVTILLVMQARQLTGYPLALILRPTRREIDLGCQRARDFFGRTTSNLG